MDIFDKYENWRMKRERTKYQREEKFVSRFVDIVAGALSFFIINLPSIGIAMYNWPMTAYFRHQDKLNGVNPQDAFDYLTVGERIGATIRPFLLTFPIWVLWMIYRKKRERNNEKQRNGFL